MLACNGLGFRGRNRNPLPSTLAYLCFLELLVVFLWPSPSFGLSLFKIIQASKMRFRHGWPRPPLAHNGERVESVNSNYVSK